MCWRSANITLDTTGVAIIEMIEENRISSIETLGLSDREMSLWRNTIGARLDTLASDLSALASRLVGTAPMDFVRRLAGDLAIAKAKLNLPEGYVAWHADYFADTSKSDTAHVDYLARVEEGIRFPPASENNSQMALLNPVDPAITSQDNFVLPAYEAVTRLSVKAPLGTVTFEQSISQFPYQSVAMKQMHRTRRRVRYGAWYWIGTDSAVALIYAAYYSGGTVSISVDGQNILLSFTTGEVMELVVVPGPVGMYRARYVWVDYVDEPYWVRTVTTRNISGSSIGESFLNSQDGWLIGVNLRFTRKGATGDVHVSICETTEGGTPDLDRTVAYATLPPSAIKVDGTLHHGAVHPDLLDQGARTPSATALFCTRRATTSCAWSRATSSARARCSTRPIKPTTPASSPRIWSSSCCSPALPRPAPRCSLRR